MYDETEEAIKRLYYTFDQYNEAYQEVLEENKKRFDANELIFVEEEIDFLRDCLSYFNITTSEDENPRESVRVFEFENHYRRYLSLIKEVMYASISRFENSNRLKIDFLEERLKAIKGSRPEDIFVFGQVGDDEPSLEKVQTNTITLKQKVLLLRYLQQLEIVRINAIHPDVTKRASIISCLINHSYKTTYDTLRLNPDDLKSKRNLTSLLSFITPLEMQELRELIEIDLKKAK